jgi:hypothetical protein
VSTERVTRAAGRLDGLVYCPRVPAAAAAAATAAVAAAALPQVAAAAVVAPALDMFPGRSCNWNGKSGRRELLADGLLFRCETTALLHLGHFRRCAPRLAGAASSQS